MAGDNSATDPLIGLHGARLPPDATLQAAGDLAAAAGLGLALALLIAPILTRLTRRRPRRPGIEAEIAALAREPDPIRVPALLRLLHLRAPDKARRYGATLYRPGALPEAAEIEQALREAR